MIHDSLGMRFEPLKCLHDIAYWNVQAQHVLVMGVPHRWQDVDPSTMARMAVGSELAVLAAVVWPRFDGHSHSVVVSSAGAFPIPQVRQVLANPSSLVEQRQKSLGRLNEGPIPVLVDHKKGFLAHYDLGQPLGYEDGSSVPGAYSEVVVWHNGAMYTIELVGPSANHQGYVPFYYSMIATLRWAHR